MNINLFLVFFETFEENKEEVDIQRLLRGDNANQISFVVVEQMPTVVSELEAAASLTGRENRWERRRAIRKTAAKMASVTVTVYNNRDDTIDLDLVSELDPTENFRLLKTGFYQHGRGIDLNGVDATTDWGTCI